MSESENEEEQTEEPRADEGVVEPLPEAVPDDYLDPKPFDPAGR